MGSEPTELIAAEIGSDWPSVGAQGQGRTSLIDSPGRGAGRGGDWGVCARDGAAGLWRHPGPSFTAASARRARPEPWSWPPGARGTWASCPERGDTLWGVGNSLPLKNCSASLQPPSGGRT